MYYNGSIVWALFYKKEKTFFRNCKKELVIIISQPYFCTANLNIWKTKYEEIIKKKIFGYNWVTSSRFLFYMQVFVVVAFLIGGCYELV